MIQCYKCQAFDHIAKNCFKTEICSICAGHHNRDKCENKQNVKCTNCSGDHPANDKDCPAYIKRLSLKLQTQQRTVPITRKEYVHQQSAFPEIRRKQDVSTENKVKDTSTSWANLSTNNQTGQENFSDIIKTIKSIFQSINLGKVLHTLRIVATRLSNAPDQFEKITILLEGITDLFG